MLLTGIFERLLSISFVQAIGGGTASVAVFPETLDAFGVKHFKLE